MSVVKKRNSIREVLGFTYPKLHTGKSWYVDFFAYDPAIGQMRRKNIILTTFPKSQKEEKEPPKLSRD